MSEGAKVKHLIRDALGDAFKLQIGLLYKIWLSNPADLMTAQHRAGVGLETAIKTYRTAMAALEEMEED